jgi:hypothetical protein
MNSDRGYQELLIFVPILFLLAAGAVIALRSGVGALESCRDYRQVARNLAQMILRVAGYIVILLGVQYFIGLRSSLGW